MNASLRKNCIISAVLIVVLIVALIIINSVALSSRALLNVLIILIILVLLAVVWAKYLKEHNLCCSKKREKEAEEKAVKPKPQPKAKEEVEVEPTRTGRVCEKSGTYVCSDHSDKSVEMEEGKRFPPCRGDGKGHSAVWILQE